MTKYPSIFHKTDFGASIHTSLGLFYLNQVSNLLLTHYCVFFTMWAEWNYIYVMYVENNIYKVC